MFAAQPRKSPEPASRGFANETGRAVILHLFEGEDYASLTAKAMTTNRASERVLQKLGFSKEGETSREVPVRFDTCLISSWRLRNA